MSFLKTLKDALGVDSDARQEPISRAHPLFVYVKIPGNISPDERAYRFEDPLQEALDRTKLGDITGGGSQLGAPDEQGRPTIEFCGLDVDLWDAASGLALVRSELTRLNAPAGTLLCYELDGEEHSLPLIGD